MIYQQTNFSVLPCCCFACPNLMEITVKQGGQYKRSSYDCAIFPDETLFLFSDYPEFTICEQRHPQCPLVEFEIKDELER